MTHPRHILVTGGAGFIGSHLVDALLARGHRVRVLDNLDPQVHGGLSEHGTPPEYFNPDAEFIYGDVRDPDAVARALAGIDAVFHQAAAVGVGQSMYRIRDYTEVNTMGTAVLLEQIATRFRGEIGKLIVASSMSIYGEGSYIDPRSGAPCKPAPRTAAQLEAQEWEPRVLEKHGAGGTPASPAAQPVPTAESKPLEPTSIYAINKRDQEEMVLVVGASYGIPAVALRYFNVYGPRQALSNPYTGVAAIFCAHYLNHEAPPIFEDGGQSRDFTHVSDIVQANLLALERSEADGMAVNVGTGRATTVLRVAELLRGHLQKQEANGAASNGQALPEPTRVGRFRAGDIRHCFADIARARALLGYSPRVAYEDGIAELIEWVRTQRAINRGREAMNELTTHHLVSKKDGA